LKREAQSLKRLLNAKPMLTFAETDIRIASLLIPCETNRALLEGLPDEEKETVAMWICVATCRVTSDDFLLNVIAHATEGEEKFRQFLRSLFEDYIKTVFDGGYDFHGWKTERFQKRLRMLHELVEKGKLPWFEKKDYWHPLADVDIDTLICMGFS